MSGQLLHKAGESKLVPDLTTPCPTLLNQSKLHNAIEKRSSHLNDKIKTHRKPPTLHFHALPRCSLELRSHTLTRRTEATTEPKQRNILHSRKTRESSTMRSRRKVLNSTTRYNAEPKKRLTSLSHCSALNRQLHTASGGSRQLPELHEERQSYFRTPRSAP